MLDEPKQFSAALSDLLSLGTGTASSSGNGKASSKAKAALSDTGTGESVAAEVEIIVRALDPRLVSQVKSFVQTLKCG